MFSKIYFPYNGLDIGALLAKWKAYGPMINLKKFVGIHFLSIKTAKYIQSLS